VFICVHLWFLEVLPSFQMKLSHKRCPEGRGFSPAVRPAIGKGFSP
jgi:hypothetical protein